jgi:hypothetical protein
MQCEGIETWHAFVLLADSCHPTYKQAGDCACSIPSCASGQEERPDRPAQAGVQERSKRAVQLGKGVLAADSPTNSQPAAE